MVLRSFHYLKYRYTKCYTDTIQKLCIYLRVWFVDIHTDLLEPSLSSFVCLVQERLKHCAPMFWLLDFAFARKITVHKKRQRERERIYCDVFVDVSFTKLVSSLNIYMSVQGLLYWYFHNFISSVILI